MFPQLNVDVDVLLTHRRKKVTLYPSFYAVMVYDKYPLYVNVALQIRISRTGYEFVFVALQIRISRTGYEFVFVALRIRISRTGYEFVFEALRIRISRT
jgi:hypothetical protein